jgi:hypothetical protein
MPKLHQQERRTASFGRSAMGVFVCSASALLFSLLSSAVGNQGAPDASIQINADKRGIDFSVYKKLKQLDREFAQYTKQNGGYWSSSDAECIRITTAQAQLSMEARKNESFLNTIYDVNPAAFDMLAELYGKILPQPEDVEAYETVKGKSLLARLSSSGNSSFSSNSHFSESEKNPFIFPESSARFSGEQIHCVAMFNNLETKIREIYADLLHFELKNAFFVALGHARAKLQLQQSKKALEEMATKIRQITPYKDSEDNVVALLGAPTSRANGHDVQLIKYRFEALKEEDLPAIERNMLHVQSSGMAIPDEYSGASKRDYVLTEVFSDGSGNVLCVSVTKFDGGSGSATEVYRAGEKPNSLHSAN